MKKYVVIFASICLFASGMTTAAVLSSPKNVSIKLDFNLESPDQDGIVEQYTLKHVWTTAVNNHKWATFQDKAQNASNRYIVLSKIENAGEKEVTIKFAILDTSKQSTLVSMPTMSVRYGQKGKIVINENNQKLALTVLATSK